MIKVIVQAAMLIGCRRTLVASCFNRQKDSYTVTKKILFARQNSVFGQYMILLLYNFPHTELIHLLTRLPLVHVRLKHVSPHVIYL